MRTAIVSFFALALIAACGGKKPDQANQNNDGGVTVDAAEPVCGNGSVEVGEECDDGTDNSDTAADSCRSDCRGPFCGDGVSDSSEDCDDGLDNANDVVNVCRLGCLAPACGDGLLDDLWGEACDDGNLASHDGCSSGCTVESPVWTELPGPSPSARYAAGVAYDTTRQRAVFYGGSNDVALGETWIFDLGGWQLLPTASSPGPIAGHSMAYDPVRDRVVIHGGNTGAALVGSTWEFDGTNWGAAAVATNPSPRVGGVMAYDIARSVMVMFGGWFFPTGTYFTGSWEYAGGDWVSVGAAVAPSARTYSCAAYDPIGSHVLQFGGQSGGANIPSNELWSWQGNTWNLMTPEGTPPPRGQTSMANLTRRGSIVLFGGSAGGAGNAPYGDTWELKDGVWEQTTPAVSPTSRIWHIAAEAPFMRGVIIFGGYNAAGVYQGTTWLYRYESAWPEESCSGGTDEDSDGLIDCDDPDCDGLPPC